MPEQTVISAQPQTAPAAATAEVSPLMEPEQREIGPELLRHLPIQRKLQVGSADDPLEKEADTVADLVMRKSEAPFIQKKASASQGVASEKISNPIQTEKGGGSPLPADSKLFMENHFARDFSGVNIHTGDVAVHLSRQLDAQAFTSGNDIYFNEGKFKPDTAEGKNLLAHELTHVVQQGDNPQIIQRKPGDIGAPIASETNDDVDVNIQILFAYYNEFPGLGGLEQIFVVSGSTGRFYELKDSGKGFSKKLLGTYPLRKLAIPPYFLVALPNNKFGIVGIQPIELENGEEKIVDTIIGSRKNTAEEKKIFAEIDKELSMPNWFLHESDKNDFESKSRYVGFAVIILPSDGSGITSSGGDGGKKKAMTRPPMPSWMPDYQKEMQQLIAETKGKEPQSTDLPDTFNVYFSTSQQKWRGSASQITNDPKKPLEVYVDIEEKDNKKEKFQLIRDKIRIRQLEVPESDKKENIAPNPYLDWAIRLKLELDLLIAKEKKQFPSATDLPDKTAIVTQEDDPNTPYLKLWLYVTGKNDEGQVATVLKTGVMGSPLIHGTKPEQLLEAVKLATLALTGVKLKPVNENPDHYKHILAPFPADIVSLNIRDDYRSVTGAELELEMELNMSVIPGMDLLNQTLVQYRGIMYTWDVYRISEVIPKEQLDKMPEDWLKKRTELQSWFKYSDQLSTANPVIKNKAFLKNPGELLKPDELRNLRHKGLTYGKATNYDRKSTIDMPMDEDEYVIFCRALVEPGDDVYRLPSEAFFTVKLVDGYRLAKGVRDARIQEIDTVTKQLAEEKDSKKLIKLKEKLEELRGGEKRTLREGADYNISSQEEFLKLVNKFIMYYMLAPGGTSVTNQMVDDAKKGALTDKEFDDMLDMWMTLETTDLDKTPLEKLYEIRKATQQNIKGLNDLKDRIDMFRDNLKGYDIQSAPVVGLVSRVTGQVYPLLLTLGVKEDKNGTQVLLVDVTTHETQGKYPGSSSLKKDEGGFDQAVHDAFVDFGHKCKYGEGYLAYRIPGTRVEGTVESAPGFWEKVKHILAIVAAVAGIIALIVGTIFTGGALAIVAGYVGIGALVIGAGLAVENIYDRAENHRLHADVELAMDILNIAGPVFQSVGALAELSKIATVEKIVQAAEATGELATAEKGVISVAMLTKLNNLIMIGKTLAIVQKGMAITNLGLIGYKTYKDLAMVAEIYANDPKKLAAMQAEIIRNAVISGTFAIIALKNEFKIKNASELDSLANNLSNERRYESAMVKSGLKDAEGNWRDPLLREHFLGKMGDQNQNPEVGKTTAPDEKTTPPVTDKTGVPEKNVAPPVSDKTTVPKEKVTPPVTDKTPVPEEKVTPPVTDETPVPEEKVTPPVTDKTPGPEEKVTPPVTEETPVVETEVVEPESTRQPTIDDSIKDAEDTVEQRRKDLADFEKDVTTQKANVKNAKGKKAKEDARKALKESEEIQELARQDYEIAKDQATKLRQKKLSSEVDVAKAAEEPVLKRMQDKRDQLERISNKRKEKLSEREKIRDWIRNEDPSKTQEAQREKVDQLEQLNQDIANLNESERATQARLKKDYDELLPLQNQTLKKIEALQAEQRAAIGITAEEYAQLRSRSPNSTIKKNIKKFNKDAVYGREIEGTPEADHIVSMHEITQMPGFSKLNRKQKLEILNMEDNFMPLDGRVNSSKGDRSFSEWEGYPPFGEIPPKTKKDMLDKESFLRVKIQQEINKLVPKG
jgi:hypothetical protein